MSGRFLIGNMLSAIHNKNAFYNEPVVVEYNTLCESVLNILKDNGYINSLTPVIAVLIPDEVGGLNKVLKTLTIAQVNVEYMYASLAGKESDDAYMIFRVEETERAENALRRAGFKIADQEEILSM